MRKAFSGDRDEAVLLMGEANQQLLMLKNMMALGGLQQLSRTIKYDGGITIMVACVFGQEYVSIHVPPKTADAPRKPSSTRPAVREATLEIVPELIANQLTETFNETVRVTGRCVVEITRVQPQSSEIVIVGYCTALGSYDTRRAFRWSSLSGMINLGVGLGGFASEANGISPDGRSIIGATYGKKITGGQMTFASYGAIVSGNDAAYQQSLVTISVSTNHVCGFNFNGGASYIYDANYVATQGIVSSVGYGIGNASPFPSYTGVVNKPGAVNFSTPVFNNLGFIPQNQFTPVTAPGPSSAGGYSIAVYNNKAAYSGPEGLISIGALPGFAYSKPNAIAVVGRADVISTSTIVISD